MSVKLRARIRELAAQYPSYGHPMLHYMIRNESDHPVNRKRTERIYNEEGLSLRKRKKKRTKLVQLRLALPPAERQDDVWSMDFIHDWLGTNQRLKVLTIVDYCTRTSPDLYAAISIKGCDVVAVLERLRLAGRKPRIIVVDNGPEFRSKALQLWATRYGVRLHFIEPGKPYQNGFIESFNGKFRAECLDRNLFETIDAARLFISAWKREYEERRPHTSLNGMTPSQYARIKQCA